MAVERNKVFYQVFLRSFTQEGTFKSAKKMFPHLKDLGVDVIWLSPICKADPDENRAYWSQRARKSGFDNPKNPYRPYDYFKVDEEYGTLDELKDFLNEAHNYGIKVLLDCVYLHCGPTSPYITERSDLFKKRSDGSLYCNYYNFPEFDFENMETQKFFWENMEYFIGEVGFDGIRSDCGGAMPTSFWVEGIKRIRAIKPDAISLIEGRNVKIDKCFDIDYDDSPSLQNILGDQHICTSVKDFITERKNHDADYIGVMNTLYQMENHDLANDYYDERFEKVLPVEVMEAIAIFAFCNYGNPMIYIGFEIADSHRHSILYNRDCKGIACVDWSNALTPKGKHRLEFTKKLVELRHNVEALSCANSEYLSDGSDNIIAMLRRGESENVLVLINYQDKANEYQLPCEAKGTYIEKGICISGTKCTMDAYGYAVIRL